jgi:hypothetical protein
MNAKLERITPETAAEMLKLNKNNRPTSTTSVKFLAREIREGRWQVNGDTITFAEDRLVDGQHRLMAVIESGIPISTFVVRGVPSESFLTKDSGRKRSAADALAINGVTWSKYVSAATKQVWLYSKTGKLDSTGLSPSTSILVEFYEQNTGISRSTQLIGAKNKLVQNSLLIALHYLFSQKDQDAADQFMNDLIMGANLDSSDSVFLLRNRLLENFSSTFKMPFYSMGALIIKAWNMRRDGKTVKRLTFKSTGEGAEDYPVIK